MSLNRTIGEVNNTRYTVRQKGRKTSGDKIVSVWPVSKSLIGILREGNKMNMLNMAISTAKEAIEKAGINWGVEKRDLFLNDSSKVEEAKAIVRSDNGSVLGIVGNRYHVIQNAEAFSPLDEFVDSGEVLYKSANSYKGGRVVSMELSLTREEKHTVRVGDDIETVIRVITSHDGSEKFSARFFMNRLVCTNGMVRPNTCFAFNVKHTASSLLKIENGFELINVARVFGREMAENARRMNETLINSRTQREYVLRVLGVKDGYMETRTENKVDEILALGQRGLGNTGRTLWDAYNVVTEYADHRIATRGENDRLTSSVLGAGLQLKERAYSVAQELVHV